MDAGEGAWRPAARATPPSTRLPARRRRPSRPFGMVCSLAWAATEAPWRQSRYLGCSAASAGQERRLPSRSFRRASRCLSWRWAMWLQLTDPEGAPNPSPADAGGLRPPNLAAVSLEDRGRVRLRSSPSVAPRRRKTRIAPPLVGVTVGQQRGGRGVVQLRAHPAPHARSVHRRRRAPSPALAVGGRSGSREDLRTPHCKQSSPRATTRSASSVDSSRRSVPRLRVAPSSCWSRRARRGGQASFVKSLSISSSAPTFRSRVRPVDAAMAYHSSRRRRS